MYILYSMCVHSTCSISFDLIALDACCYTNNNYKRLIQTDEEICVFAHIQPCTRSCKGLKWGGRVLGRNYPMQEFLQVESKSSEEQKTSLKTSRRTRSDEQAVIRGLFAAIHNKWCKRH